MIFPCFFRDRLGWPDCDGRHDPCHLIPQQRIKNVAAQRHEPVPDLDDPRLIVNGCRHHHGLFDNKRLVLERSEYPASLLEWAREHRYFWAGHPRGWVGEA